MHQVSLVSPLTAGFSLRQCGARPGELCRATIADIDRAANAIVVKEHKTARKTGKPRRIPIGRKLAKLLDQAIGKRSEGPIFLSPAGKSWTVPNLSRTYGRLRDNAGLPNDLVLYLARHECGTKICREKPPAAGSREHQYDAAVHAPRRPGTG